MFMTLAAGLGSMVGQSLMQGGSSALGAWATNTARESLNKNITKTNLKTQKAYDLWTQQQDMRYNKDWEQWYQNYMYGLQNNEYYNLARRYGENTATWAVNGLRKAGLNPILAAIDGNLSSNLGNASPQSSPSGRHSKGSLGGGSAPSIPSASPVRASMIQDLINSAKQGELMDSQKNVQSAQANNLNAQAELANAQTANAKANEGMTGAIGAVFNLANRLGLKHDLESTVKAGLGWVKRKMLGTYDITNTAKSGLSEDQLKSFAEPPKSILSDADALQRDRENAHRKLEIEKERLRGMPWKGKMSPIWSR